MSLVGGYIPNERVITLTEGQEILIRRASSRDESRYADLTNLHFRNTHLSKTHAVLKYENGSFYLKDGGSTFGTVVNNNFLLEGAWAKLVTGDTAGFIVTKPLSVIADVILKHSHQATVPLSEFQAAALGLEFLVQVKENVIKFLPIEVVDVKDDSLDFTKEVTEVTDEETEDTEITEADKGDVPVNHEEILDEYQGEQTQPETIIQEDILDDSDNLYNLDCCPGLAGTIQRHEPSSKPSESLLSRLFEFFLDRFSSSPKEDSSRKEDEQSDSAEDIELILDGENQETDDSEYDLENEVELNCSCTRRVEENDDEEEEEEEEEINASRCAFSEEEDSELDELLNETNTGSASDINSHSNISDSDSSLYISSDLDSDSNSESSLVGIESDAESVSDVSDVGSLLDINTSSDISSLSSDASLISDILKYEAQQDDSESDSDDIEVTPVQIGKNLYLVANNEVKEFNGPETDCWGCWSEPRKSRKRTFDEANEDEEDDYDSEESNVTGSPEKKAKKTSSLKTFAKEVGKGLFYVLATIAALGVYGGTLNDQGK